MGNVLWLAKNLVLDAASLQKEEIIGIARVFVLILNCYGTVLDEESLQNGVEGLFKIVSIDDEEIRKNAFSSIVVDLVDHENE